MRIFRLAAAVSLAMTTLAFPMKELAKASETPSDVLRDGRSTHSHPETSGTDGFTLLQVRNTKYRGRNGLEAMLQAYAKYNTSLTPQLENALRVNPDMKAKLRKRLRIMGSVLAFPPYEYDYEYVSPVQIGSPPQTVLLNVDTGSADLWVFSTDTPPDQVRGQLLYDPAASRTSAIQPGRTWQIRYGDGSGAGGIAYTDRVSVGGAAADGQTVQSATAVSAWFSADGACSGLLGLGMGGGNTVRPGGARTFADNVRARLRQPLFTADLRRAGEGRYDFGFINASAHVGAVQYAKADERSVYWTFAVGGFRIGRAGAYVRAPWVAIADTGTSLLLVPGAVVDAYYARVEGARLDDALGGVVFPCGAALPDFFFGIGRYRGRVPGGYINYGVAAEGLCFGGIQSSDAIGFGVFGDVALKAQFVVFDLGHMRLGFANKPLLE